MNRHDWELFGAIAGLCALMALLFVFFARGCGPTAESEQIRVNRAPVDEGCRYSRAGPVHVETCTNPIHEEE